LSVPDPEIELRYVIDAVRLIRRELAGRVPLIGFAGSPWTLATYMVEGGSSKDYARIKGLLYDQPELLHRLLDVTARAVTTYLNAQIAAGAQAADGIRHLGRHTGPARLPGIFAGLHGRIVAGLTREAEKQPVPVILFTKGGGAWLEDIAATGCDAVGVDWTVDLGDARRRVGARVALQGNLDPAALYAAPERIRQQTAQVLADYGAGPGHVFNLGHGIQPGIDPEHVRVLVEAVHHLSIPYHAPAGMDDTR
jgi:uroporphyrinogen decarboxylase